MIIETRHGPYRVDGAERFAISGDIAAEVRAAVDARSDPVDAVVWDDAVLDMRPRSLSCTVQRVTISSHDLLLASQFDSSGRAAVRVMPGEAGGVNEVLARLAAASDSDIVHAPGLLRFIGWPEAAPLRAAPAPQPPRKAASIAIVINYRDKADTTLACLRRIRQQVCDARIEIALVNNQSQPLERQAVEAGADSIFADDSRVTLLHLEYDRPFNHSAQCNMAADRTTGEVLIMLSNDCFLLSADALETMAAWALKPGVATAGLRLVGEGGGIVSAGMALVPIEKNGLPAWRIQEADVDYLSRLARQTNGNTFGCAAIARTVWTALGGLDAKTFPTDYNDADFALRGTQADYVHVYCGGSEALHQPGRSDRSRRAQAALLHERVEDRHRLDDVARASPFSQLIKRAPLFNHSAANQIGDFVRLYKMVVGARNAEADRIVLQSFEAIIAELGARSDLDAILAAPQFSLARRQRVFELMHQACRAFIRGRSGETVPVRYIQNFPPLDVFDTLAHLVGVPASAHLPMDMPRAAMVGKLEDLRFALCDGHFQTADIRLLVLADRMGPSQQIFVEGLRNARQEGRIGLAILTESELQHPATPARLVALVAQLWPTVVIYSQFGDGAAHAALERALATDPRGAAARVFHAGTDVFALPLQGQGAGRDVGRHPRRYHAMDRIARGADLVIAACETLAERLAHRLGSARVTWPVHGLGVSSAPPRAHARGLLRVGILGDERVSAGSGPEMEVQSIADPALLNDYGALCLALRRRAWDIALISEVDPNGPPYLWAACAQAGAAVLACDSPAHRALAREGALQIVHGTDWEGAVRALASNPARRAALSEGASRLLATRYDWDRAGQDLLALLSRATAARRAQVAQGAG